MIAKTMKNRLLGLSLLATSAVLVGCQSKESKAIEFAESGQVYLEEGDLERATIQFNNALFQDGSNIAALRGAAEIARIEKNYVRQARMLARIIAELPDDIPANAEFARITLLAGQPDKAKEHASKVLELEPDNTEALTTMGAALVLENEVEEATLLLQRALAQDPDNPEIFNLLAAGSIRAENYEEAIATINEGIEKADDPEPLLIVKLVMAEQFRGRDEVIETFEHLIRIRPENGFYRERLGEYYLLKDRDLETARSYFVDSLPRLEDKSRAVTRIVAIDRELKGDGIAETTLQTFVNEYAGDNELRFTLPAFYCQSEQLAKCKAEFQKIADTEALDDESKIRALNGIADVAMAERNFDQAADIASQVLALDETNPSALITQGQLLLVEEKSEEAIEIFRTALQAEPDNAEGLVYLALAYENAGQIQFADAQFARAVDQVGYTKSIVDQFRGFLNRQGETDRAVELLSRYQRENPNDLDAVYQSGEAAMFERRYDDALEVANTLAETNNFTVQSLSLSARALIGLQRFEEALPKVDGYLEQYPDDAQFLNLRTRVMEQLGQQEFAEDDLRERLASSDAVASDYLFLSQFLVRQQRPQEAFDIAQEGIEKFADQEQLYVAAYLTANQLQNTADARRALVEGNEAASTKTQLRTFLSNDLINDGNFDEAISVLRSLKDDDDLTPLTANNLASLLLEREGSEAEALEIAKVLEDTDNPYFADTLAWAYFKAGQLASAARYSRLSVRSLDQNVDVLYHHGVIEAAQGNTAAAQTSLEKAIENYREGIQTPLADIESALTSLSN